jgi:DNA-binding NarL/FixJ family response regulator
MSPITVVIADDEALFRSGLRMLLEAQEGIEVVAEATTGRQAVELVRRHAPDVVLMDIQMPDLDGLAATRELVRSGSRTRVLVLTTFDLDRTVFDALAAGAAGFLLKSARPARLVDAIRTVADGDALLDPTLTRRLIDRWMTPTATTDTERVRGLTEREREVLTLMGSGLNNREIAQRLFLGESTVKTHVVRVLAKTGSRDRIQAVILAHRCGLVDDHTIRAAEDPAIRAAEEHAVRAAETHGPRRRRSR